MINSVAEQLTGWTIAEAKGRPIAEVFHIINEETRAEVENPALRAIREGAICGLANHTCLIARDGREISIDDSGAPIKADGKVLGAILVFRDITERQRAERPRPAGRHCRFIRRRNYQQSLEGVITSGTIRRAHVWMVRRAIGRNIIMIIPEEMRRRKMIRPAATGTTIEHFETVRVSKSAGASIFRWLSRR